MGAGGTIPGVMNPFANTEQTSLLVRCYSDRREEDVVLRVQFKKEQAGGCSVFYLSSIEVLSN